MAEEYTPSAWDDARIREAFIYDGGEAEYHDPINGAREQRRTAGEIFDKWLAAHDEAVRHEERARLARIVEGMYPPEARPQGAIIAGHIADRIREQGHADQG